MSNSQNTENEQQNNLCTTLTEQWKKGELPCGWYYIKVADIVFIDFFEGKVWKNKKDKYIDDVLAPVPSYEEWRRLQSSWVDEMGKAVDLQKALEWSNEQYNTKVPVLESENQQLKELLKEGRGLLDNYNHTFEIKDWEKSSNLITKIDNAIGDK